MGTFTKRFKIDAPKLKIGDVVLRAIDSEGDYHYPKTITKVFNIEDKMMVFHYDDDNPINNVSSTGKCFACKVDAEAYILRKLSTVLEIL